MLSYTITNEDIDNLLDELGDELTFDPERRNALINNNDIQACPGSGKTTMVAYKLILLAKMWIDTHRGICVLTHTNVAKEEILKHLRKHPSGYKLLSYPHFVGTIQEYINRYLGIPFCRSNTWTVNRIDDDICVEFLERSLNWKTKQYLNNKPSASLYNLKYYLNKNNLNIKVPGFDNYSDSKSYQDLVSKKNMLVKNGFYYYSEMYVFAVKLILENPHIKKSLQLRFPYVFIDEMQDTQKFQDDLLNSIFVSDDVVLQRYGDPDQAIFNGFSGDMPNESYNAKQLETIEDSHRFGNDIAFKIKGFSYRQLANLRSARKDPEGNYPHTVILYNDASIKKVLPDFGELVSTVIPENQRWTVKAVGAVGWDNPNGLTIKHYWDSYDKTKSTKSFKAEKLIHIVKKCSEQKAGNVYDNYELLFQAVIDFLYKSDKKALNKENEEVYYGKASLIKELKSNLLYEKYRNILTSWIIEDFPGESRWNEQIIDLKELLGLDDKINQKADDYIVYDDQDLQESDDNASITNLFKCKNGVDIEVSTIHAVKGETHDATLVMETKFDRYFDISSLIDYLIDENKQRPQENFNSPRCKASIQAGFLKKLYVATSRPKHLLCLAINEENVSKDQIDSLTEKGWNIKNI